MTGGEYHNHDAPQFCSVPLKNSALQAASDRDPDCPGANTGGRLLDLGTTLPAMARDPRAI